MKSTGHVKTKSLIFRFYEYFDLSLILASEKKKRLNIWKKKKKQQFKIRCKTAKKTREGFGSGPLVLMVVVVMVVGMVIVVGVVIVMVVRREGWWWWWWWLSLEPPWRRIKRNRGAKRGKCWQRVVVYSGW